jgi:hypothetical protein
MQVRTFAPVELNQNSLAVGKPSSKDREGHGFRAHGKALDSYQAVPSGKP